MQPTCSVSMMAQISEEFERCFPGQVCRDLWQLIDPHRYRRKVESAPLIQAFAMAMLMGEPSQQSVALRWGEQLGTCNPSTLSYALRRPSSLAMAAELSHLLEKPPACKSGQLLALDSMPLTITASRRPPCRTINASACGGAVLWAMSARTEPGESPLHVLRLIVGPSHDSLHGGDLALQPQGPTYVMDIGFWSLANVRGWIERGVWFIVRVPLQSLLYESLRECGKPRQVKRGLSILYDGVARLGGKSAKCHPEARVVVATMVNKDGKDEDLVLVSNHRSWGGERLLDAFSVRHDIETFHHTFKESLGMAHLYSFHESGMFFLLYAGLILIALAMRVLGMGGAAATAVLETLSELRWRLGVAPTHWRPNTARPMRTKGRKRKRRRKQPTKQLAQNH